MSKVKTVFGIEDMINFANFYSSDHHGTISIKDVMEYANDKKEEVRKDENKAVEAIAEQEGKYDVGDWVVTKKGNVIQITSYITQDDANNIIERYATKEEIVNQQKLDNISGEATYPGESNTAFVKELKEEPEFPPNEIIKEGEEESREVGFKSKKITANLKQRYLERWKRIEKIETFEQWLIFELADAEDLLNVMARFQ